MAGELHRICYLKKGYQSGRIELIPLHGDIEKDKFEIGTITLPIEEWQYLRKMHDSKKF